MTDRLFHLIRDTVVLWDEGGRITAWNPAAATLYGWTEDEAVGAPVEDLLLPRLDQPDHRGRQAVPPGIRPALDPFGKLPEFKFCAVRVEALTE